MALVDITLLTENQQYGLTYEMQQLNVQIQQENDSAAQYNATRPINSEALPIKDLYTLETYAAKVLTDSANRAYINLLNYKQEIAIQKFYSASPEKQAQALAILEVPDVVQ
jgi:hypothetical protein